MLISRRCHSEHGALDRDPVRRLPSLEQLADFKDRHCETVEELSALVDGEGPLVRRLSLLVANDQDTSAYREFGTQLWPGAQVLQKVVYKRLAGVSPLGLNLDEPSE